MTERNWLQEMWRSGYCRDAVHMAAGTNLDAEGAEERLLWMQEHLPTCQECKFANLLKAMEASVAKELDFSEQFENGGDVSKQLGYREVLDRHLRIGMRLGLIDASVVGWMARVVERQRTPWPGATH